MRNTITRSGGFLENVYLCAAVFCISLIGGAAFSLLSA